MQDNSPNFTPIFMQDFHAAYRLWPRGQNSTLRTQVPYYLHLLPEQARTLAQTQSKSLLTSFCRTLKESGYLSAAVLFLFDVFSGYVDYNRKVLQETFSQIQVTEDCDLAQLGAEFFLSAYQEFDREYHSLFGNSNPFDGLSPQQLYQTDRSDNSIADPLVLKYLPEYLAQRLYGLSLSVNEASKSDVDALAAALTEQRRLSLEQEAQRRKAINDRHQQKELEIKQKQGVDYHLTRQAELTLSDYQLRFPLPGGLLALFQACDLAGKSDLCFYILEEYVLPCFACVPWGEEANPDVHLMAALLSKYTDYLYAFVCPFLSTVSHWDSEAQLDEALKQGRAQYHNHTGMALALAATIRNGNRLLRQVMSAEHYAFLTAFTPYLLLCSGEEQAAASFLTEYYEELPIGERQKLYVQATLVQCIRSADDLEEASILYHYFQSETTDALQKRRVLGRVASSMADYLESVKNHLRQTNEYTLRQETAWFDLVFGNGRIEALAEQIRHRDGLLPSAAQFRLLRHYVTALAHPTGIFLPLLGIPNQDGYDKLPNALSRELVARGQGYLRKTDHWEAVYRSISLIDLRQTIAARLQELILDKSARQIQTVKSEDAIHWEDCLNETMDEAQRKAWEEKQEEKLREIDRICRQMGGLGNEADRLQAEKLVHQSHASFCEKYAPEETDLLSRLDDDTAENVRRSIITSELAYQCLIRQKNPEHLDFTAALSPLTKSVEMILNYIFRAIPEDSLHKIKDGEQKSYYMDKDNKKLSHVAFRAGSFLFKSDVFQHWKDKNIVDLERLSGLNGKSITVDLQQDGTRVKAEKAFGTTLKNNRALLIQGLDYIREHHRNIAAHEKPVSRDRMDECREVLLQTRDMLWILLFLLNRPPFSTDTPDTQTD